MQDNWEEKCRYTNFSGKNELRLTLFERGEKVVDEVSGVAFEGRNNVLDGTLEQSNDVGNNLVLALHSAESIELVSTYIEAFLSISCLNGRNGVVLVGNLLNQLGTSCIGVSA